MIPDWEVGSTNVCISPYPNPTTTWTETYQWRSQDARVAGARSSSSWSIGWHAPQGNLCTLDEVLSTQYKMEPDNSLSNPSAGLPVCQNC